jgi:hypothetical protein
MHAFARWDPWSVSTIALPGLGDKKGAKKAVGWLF